VIPAFSMQLLRDFDLSGGGRAAMKNLIDSR
jgi:hypothetical protein